jgi:hypothetical protein
MSGRAVSSCSGVRISEASCSRIDLFGYGRMQEIDFEEELKTR